LLIRVSEFIGNVGAPRNRKVGQTDRPSRKCLSLKLRCTSNTNAAKRNLLAMPFRPGRFRRCSIFRITCEKSVNDSGNDSEVCDVRETPLTCTRRMGPAFTEKGLEKAVRRSGHPRTLACNPLQAAPSKDDSLIDLRKYAVSLPYLALFSFVCAY
jgi:hypothetical protein